MIDPTHTPSTWTSLPPASGSARISAVTAANARRGGGRRPAPRRSCIRARITRDAATQGVERSLARAGAREVFNLDGGMLAWSGLSLPVEHGR